MYTNRLTPTFPSFYWLHTFFDVTCSWMLAPKSFQTDNIFSGGGGSFPGGGGFASIIFFRGSFLPKDFLQADIISRQRLHHVIIREGSIVKGESNPGAVVLVALAPRPFGSSWDFWMVQMRGNYTTCRKLSICYMDKNLCTRSGCAFPFELSKRSKCVETQFLVL